MSAVQEEYELSEEVERLWNMRLQEQRNESVEERTAGTSEVLPSVSNQKEVPLQMKEEEAMVPKDEQEEIINNLHIERDESSQCPVQQKHEFLAEADSKQVDREHQVSPKEREDGSVSEVKASHHDVKCTTTTEDNSYTAASASGEFLKSGKTADDVLGLAISEVMEHLEREPYATSVLGETISSLRGHHLQDYITEVVHNESKMTSKPIVLVLESFTQDQIYDLYENHFIKRILQNQPQLAHIIFLNCSHQNVKSFFGSPLKKCQNGSDELLYSEPIDSRDANFHEYANSETIRRTDVPTPNTFVMDDDLLKVPLIHSQPVSTFNTNRETGNPFHMMKMENVYDGESSGTWNYISMESMEKGKFIMDSDKNEDDRACLCVRCFRGILSFIGSMIAQFGDCFFY